MLLYILNLVSPLISRYPQSDDEDFQLQSGPAASRPAAPPSSSASLPPPSPLGETASIPLSPVDTPPPAAKPPAPEAASSAPAADNTPSSSSLPSLPDIKRPLTSSLPAIGGGSSKNVQLAGLSVEELEKIEKKEQRKKVRHARAHIRGHTRLWRGVAMRGASRGLGCNQEERKKPESMGVAASAQVESRVVISDCGIHHAGKGEEEEGAGCPGAKAEGAPGSCERAR